jgi:hypothetical protein
MKCSTQELTLNVVVQSSILTLLSVYSKYKLLYGSTLGQINYTEFFLETNSKHSIFCSVIDRSKNNRKWYFP